MNMQWLNRVVAMGVGIIVMAVAGLAVQAATVYTVDGVVGQGTGWNGSGIVAWDGSQQVTLTSGSTFTAGDELNVTLGKKLEGANFNGWNLGNLTIKAHVTSALANTKWAGATYSSTIINNTASARAFNGTTAGNTAFSGNLTGLTINMGVEFWRDGNHALNGSSFQGAVINISGNTAFIQTGGSPSVSFNGATINWGATRTLYLTNHGNFDWSGVTLTINAINFWRDGGSGIVSTDWTNSTIKAVSGGLFDAFNENGMFNGQTFDFAGATLSGNIFSGLSQHELNNGGFTLDFTKANVGGITSSPDVALLSNFEIWYSRNTIFGDFTEQQAINANWTFIPEPSSLLLLAAGGLLLMRRCRR